MTKQLLMTPTPATVNKTQVSHDLRMRGARGGGNELPAVTNRANVIVG